MVTIKLPIDTRPNQFSATFSALFQNPTVGEYDFDAPQNKGVDMGPTVPGALYLISVVNVGGSLPEEEYLRAVKKGNTPNLKFFWKSDTTASIFPEPIRFVNFFRNQTWMAWAHCKKGSDRLLGSMSGSLVQTDFLVGTPEFFLSVVLTAYEITDKAFIRMFEQKSDEFFRNPQRIFQQGF